MPLDPRGLARRLVQGSEEMLWPTRCVSCDMPGELICEECRAAMPWIRQQFACPNCGAPFGALTCTECDGPWEARATICALGFGQISAQMVAFLKDKHELRLAGVNAAAIACALDEASSWPAADGAPRFDASRVDALCFVPATAAAYRRRGFDHMELVSRELSRFTGIPLMEVLVRGSARDQRTLGKEDRARNLAGSVWVCDDVCGMRLLLVDDVVTTGATMREATRVLLSRGAAEVTCAAVARVW